MTHVRDIMSKHVESVSRKDSLKDIADKMRQLNVGAMPVSDNGKVIGILTDRDIAIRAVAKGMDPNSTTADKIMTKNVVFCHDDETIDQLSRTMKSAKIRRAVVLDRNEKLTGICSLGDVARSQDDLETSADILRTVSAHA